MAAHLDTIVERETASLEPFVASYRPLPGVFDEMMDGDGRVRLHWRRFLGMLAALGSDEINRRFAAADRYLRGSGVYYRVYEDGAGIERPWPLSHVPLIIEPTEWRELEAGLIERAALLEAVLADAYGPSLLSRDGRLPAALIAGNPEFLGRSSVSRHPAAPICAFTRSTSGAAPTAAGGCLAIARKRPRAPATRSRTGWRCRARSPTSIARRVSNALRRSSRPSRPNSPRSAVRTTLTSVCSRLDR
jgi:uncharacterized circularly permuted ATP-grasp superfamily protein